MTRNTVLALGAIAWLGVALYATLRAIEGYWIDLVIAAIVVTTVLVVYHLRPKVLETS
jgi:hypothetical protein